MYFTISEATAVPDRATDKMEILDENKEALLKIGSNSKIIENNSSE